MSRETLLMWQDRLERNDSAYSAEREKMDARELLYKGGREMLFQACGQRGHGSVCFKPSASLPLPMQAPSRE